MPEKSREGQGGRVRVTQKERRLAEIEKRRDLMRQQIEEGSLVVRKMTDEERSQYPPRPRPKRGKGSKPGTGI